RVAVVSPDGVAQFKKVTISRDLGKVIEIGSGLQPADLVIESPPDGLLEGDKVRLKADVPKSGPA
ncbi:efflux RND transporter periplasmic adaptor subunit, partial [Acinetobacter baumannii]